MRSTSASSDGSHAALFTTSSASRKARPKSVSQNPTCACTPPVSPAPANAGSNWRYSAKGSAQQMTARSPGESSPTICISSAGVAYRPAGSATRNCAPVWGSCTPSAPEAILTDSSSIGHAEKKRLIRQSSGDASLSSTRIGRGNTSAAFSVRILQASPSSIWPNLASSSRYRAIPRRNSVSRTERPSGTSPAPATSTAASNSAMPAACASQRVATRAMPGDSVSASSSPCPSAGIRSASGMKSGTVASAGLNGTDSWENAMRMSVARPTESTSERPSPYSSHKSAIHALNVVAVCANKPLSQARARRLRNASTCMNVGNNTTSYCE